MLHIEHRAIYIHAIGVGAVEHHHFLVVFCSSLHQVNHSNIIGVEAETYILNIYHNNIKSAHSLLARMMGFSFIERCNRYSSGWIHAAAHLLPGVGSAAKSVFGRENGGNVKTILEHNVEGVLLAHHAGHIAEYGYALALEQRHISVGARSTHHHLGALTLGCRCSA